MHEAPLKAHSGPQVAEQTSQSLHGYYPSGNERTLLYQRYIELLNVIKIAGTLRKRMCAMIHQERGF